MNDRKEQVIEKAHQLFIEKGFQDTSIQDILNDSGISKGTFYNYFSSKNELLMAIFNSLNRKIDKERNDLLIGQDPSNIEIFIQQIELQMAFNQRNKLITLFEEVFVSNDPTLKEFLKRAQIMQLRWTYNRLVDIFDRSKAPYLLDCAIMFTGMLHHNIHFYFLTNQSDANIKPVIRYTVGRLEKLVDEVKKSGIHLFEPEIFGRWLPNDHKSGHALNKKLYSSVLALKKCLSNGKNQLKHLELLDFIQEEILQSKTPRKFLIKSALSSLAEDAGTSCRTELQKLEQIIKDFCTQKEIV
jgi:AcrR family transcriptional regulator